MKNTLQVVAASIFNMATFSYSIVQLYQINKITKCVGEPTYIDPDFCVNKGLIVNFEKSTVQGINETTPYLIAIIALVYKSFSLLD